MESFAQVIDRFGGSRSFADAVGMTPKAAKLAYRRDSLNARWFTPTAEAARVKGIPIDEKTLCAIASRQEGARAA